MVLLPKLTNTGCIVRTLALSLLRRYLTIYLDNYFTSIPLFSELRTCNFSTVRTTRAYAEFPRGLIALKDRFRKKLEWNTLVTAVIQDVLCLAWQDNNIVLSLSNVYTMDKADNFRERVRKRLAKTLTNGRIIRKVFRDNYIKELSIPYFINDYNQYIRGVNLANQFREAYETYKPTCRN